MAESQEATMAKSHEATISEKAALGKTVPSKEFSLQLVRHFVGCCQHIERVLEERNSAFLIALSRGRFGPHNRYELYHSNIGNSYDRPNLVVAPNVLPRTFINAEKEWVTREDAVKILHPFDVEIANALSNLRKDVGAMMDSDPIQAFLGETTPHPPEGKTLQQLQMQSLHPNKEDFEVIGASLNRLQNCPSLFSIPSLQLVDFDTLNVDDSFSTLQNATKVIKLSLIPGLQVLKTKLLQDSLCESVGLIQCLFKELQPGPPCQVPVLSTTLQLDEDQLEEDQMEMVD